MQSYFSYAIYVITLIIIIVSFFKSKNKTLLALKKAWKMFISILPQFISILLAMGIILSIITVDTIKAYIALPHR